MHPKPKRIKDPELLKCVAEMPCLICRDWPSDPHHITTRGAGGGDVADNLAPLCRKHHQKCHLLGNRQMANVYPQYWLWLENHGRFDILDDPLKDNLN